MNYTPDHIHHLENMMCQENEATLRALQATFHDRYNKQERLDHYVSCLNSQLFPPEIEAITPPLDYPAPETWELYPKDEEAYPPCIDAYKLLSNPLVLISVTGFVLAWIWALS